MKEEKGLQKFTDSESKYKYLFSLDYVKSEDFEILNEEEQKVMRSRIYESAQDLEVFEKHLHFVKYKNCMEESTRNKVWESNHQYIIDEISRFIKKHKKMPTVSFISQESGLSRTTVHKHMETLLNSDLFREQMSQFIILVPSLLGKLYDMGMDGDVNATKLFLKSINSTGANNINIGTYNEQTNYIQVNNTVISQDQIKGLSEDQVEQLEVILKGIKK